jgi:hypothetical protein
MKALNKIDVRSVYNEERGGFGSLRVPKMYPKRGNKEKQQNPIYRQNKTCC